MDVWECSRPCCRFLFSGSLGRLQTAVSFAGSRCTRSTALTGVDVRRLLVRRLYPLSFLQSNDLVCLQILKHLPETAGPGDLGAVHFGCVAQTEVQALIVTGNVTAAASDIINLPGITRDDCYSGAKP